MAHAVHRSAVNGAKPSVTKTVHRACVAHSMRTGARPLEAMVAMSNCALAMGALTMSVAAMLRCFIRSMGAAHDLTQIETGIVGDLPPALTDLNLDTTCRKL